MYQIPELLKFPNLFHAFSTKDDGNMANAILGKVSDFGEVSENREKFLASLNISANETICMLVVHGDGVKVAEKFDAGKSISGCKFATKVDGLVTNEKGLYLFLLVADCLPIILYDPIKSALGLVHAGWKGADLEIVKKVIGRLRDLYNTKSKDLIVGIGPAARKDSFIKENPSQKDSPRWENFLEQIDDTHYKVDFVGLCKKQIIDSGVLERNIFDCGIDTVTDERFYSHVREGKLPLSKQGRFACVVGLRNNWRR